MTNFPALITKWYQKYGRDLPWRDTRDPYKIWIAEIIFQQTQIKQGTSYYHNFLKAFPDIQSLAKAPEELVMQQWQGLGYYSRARNIHHTAKVIVNENNGNFPQTYKKIRDLKGIGPYTAAAIASFAFKMPYAVVDGNVYRLLSRFFAIGTPIDSTTGKKQFEKLAEELLDKDAPDLYNQAIMDMGATVCKPANPLCDECPLSDDCKAFQTGTQEKYPVKSKKMVRKKRYLNFLIIITNEEILLQKRTGKDIWQGLYQFPLIETKQKNSVSSIASEIAEQMMISPKISKLLETKHLLTHQELHVSFYKLLWPENRNIPKKMNDLENKMVAVKDLPDHAFPQIIQKNLKKIL